MHEQRQSVLWLLRRRRNVSQRPKSLQTGRWEAILGGLVLTLHHRFGPCILTPHVARQNVLRTQHAPAAFDSWSCHAAANASGAHLKTNPCCRRTSAASGPRSWRRWGLLRAGAWASQAPASQRLFRCEPPQPC